MGDLVEVRRDGKVATVTLNRPDKRNAMNLAAQADLRDALMEVRDMRSIVLHGAGGTFCSGIDLKERRELDQREPSADRRAQRGNSWIETNQVIREHPAVIIAAVQGYALGGGLTLVHNCDLAFASESARFGMPEVTFGAFPAYAGPASVRRILPKHVAYMVFTGQKVDAQTAERWGIVNGIHPDDGVVAAAHQVAEHVAGFDPTTLDFSKKALHDLEVMPWEAAMEHGEYIGTMTKLNRVSPDQS